MGSTTMSHNTECHMNKKGPPIKATYDQTVRGGGSFLHESAPLKNQ